VTDEPRERGGAATPPSAASTSPYPPSVRRFLVQFAGLGATSRAEVVARHAALVNTPLYESAEQLIGETIERAGRSDSRDALAGPFLQLVRRTDAPATTDDVLAMLDPIAEPALAALLALLVADLVPAATVDVLCEPFKPFITID